MIVVEILLGITSSVRLVSLTSNIDEFPNRNNFSFALNKIVFIITYLKKYNKLPKKEQPEEVNEIEPVSFNAEEDEATKTKEKTIDPNEKNNNTPVLENPEVKRLREMKAFLLHEKELKRPVVSQEPKVYRKK